jgi:hypothetical protein
MIVFKSFKVNNNFQTAAAKNLRSGNGLADLPEDQRKCVITKFQSSHEVLV